MSYFSSSVEEAIQKVLNELSKDCYENHLTYRLIKRENLKTLCMNVKSFFGWNFNFQEFYDNLCKMPHLPLELLWNFHVFQIIPLDTYLLNFNSKYSNQNFKENVIAFSTQDSENDPSLFFSQTGLMSFIVSHAFPDFEQCHSNEEIKQICKPIVESFLNSIFLLSEKDFVLARLKIFFALWTCGTIGVDSLQAFSYFGLQKFLSESSSSVEEAFISHSSWRNKSDPFHLLPAIKMLVETLKPAELSQIFKKAIWKDINWKNFTIFIASMSDDGSHIKKIVTDLIKDGFDNLDFISIQKAVLIGRQISLKSNDSFSMAYTSWMQNNIWENIQSKSFHAVSLLIQVLSDLVPYEKDADCIKLFLGRPVHIPLECQSLYSDYVTLLKTRVKDLQPCVDAEKVLEKTLNIFKENGKIPPYVLEASLMNKHHYLNEFLPVLLKPRVIPAVPDVKERLIEKLNKSSKIPTYMYRQYKFSCQQEQHNLLAGINLADENFIKLIDDDDIQMTN